MRDSAQSHPSADAQERSHAEPISGGCARAGRLFGGCKFSPRYDLAAPDLDGVKVSGVNLVTFMEAIKAKTYVRDVCERCGRTIERAT